MKGLKTCVKVKKRRAAVNAVLANSAQSGCCCVVFQTTVSTVETLFRQEQNPRLMRLTFIFHLVENAVGDNVSECSKASHTTFLKRSTALQIEYLCLQK
jgi:hypothetical protein